MTDFSKKSETKEYFNSLMDDLKQSKVKSIFSFCSLSWCNRGCRIYDTDESIYILLQNDYCLVVNYPFIDALDIQFRKLDATEYDQYSELCVKDFFNIVNEIGDYGIETCNLEYGNIVDVSLKSVTYDYEKWIDGDIELVPPIGETFDEIRFIMSNGKSFVICPDEAIADGYALLWSEDAEETFT